MNFDPTLDHPFQGGIPEHEPDFSENQMWNFSDGQYGVMYHVGTMPGDLGLWHNVFSISCPDGSVLATKVVGRSEPGMFGTHSIHSRTLEPYKSWRIQLDGAMRRYRPEDLWAAPGADGLHIPVRVELEISATHPVWEPGAGASEAEPIFHTMARMHHEQALAVKGRIEIEGETIEFNGIGHRDHSYGPRDVSKLLRGNWFNATFDSGWAFLTFWGEDRTGVQERTAIFENGQIITGSTTHTGQLASIAAEPRQFEITIRTQDKRQRTLKVRCTQSSSWFSPGMEWCLGTDLSNPLHYLWRFDFAEYECEGERGIGFVDRGSRAELLKTP